MCNDTPLYVYDLCNIIIDHRPWNGTHRTVESVQKDNMALSADRKAKVNEATLPENRVMSWSVIEDEIEAISIKNKINK